MLGLKTNKVLGIISLSYNLIDLPDNINKREQKRNTKVIGVEEKHHISETGLSKNAPFNKIFDWKTLSDNEIISQIVNKAELTYFNLNKHLFVL